MDDLMGVHVMASTNELYHEEPRLGFGKDATAMKHAHERAIRAEFQGHIDILFIFETVKKPNDVGMVQRFVDLNLCIELNPDQHSGSSKALRMRTLVLAFFVLRELLVTTLQASCWLRESVTW